MWAVQRARAFLSSSTTSSLCSSSFSQALQPRKLGFSGFKHVSSSSVIDDRGKGILDLQEIEKVLSDVRADDVKVMPVPKHCDWTDYMVLATGRSTWHVKNIAQALIYKVGPFALSLSCSTLHLCIKLIENGERKRRIWWKRFGLQNDRRNFWFITQSNENICFVGEGINLWCKVIAQLK